MSIPGRLKSEAGGDIYPNERRTIASATAMVIPDWTNLFYVSGTTTVATITVPTHLRNRRLTLIGASGAAATFTNNNTPTTAGQMYLKGSDRLLSEDTVLELFVKVDGTVVLVNFTG